MKYLKKIQILLIFILVIGCESNSKNELSTPASHEMIEQMKAGDKPTQVNRKL